MSRNEGRRGAIVKHRTVVPEIPEVIVNNNISGLYVKGKDNYTLAVESGEFVGTLSEYLASLHGKPFEFSDFTPEMLEQLKGYGVDYQYSIDGVAWNASSVDAVYMRFKSQETSIWDPGFRVRGLDGASLPGPPGASVQYQFSINGATDWHDIVTESDRFMRMKMSNESTWSIAIQIKGEDGLPGMAGKYLDARFNKNGSLVQAPAYDPQNPNAGTGWTTNYPTVSLGEYVWEIRGWKEADGSFVSGNTWMTPIRKTFVDGQGGRGYVVSIVFRRSLTAPATPTGGNFENLVPVGWSDGVPQGTDPLYSSKRIFTSDGQTPQEATWSTPTLAMDSVDIDFEWSTEEAMPGDPITSPDSWTNIPTEDAKWMAMRKRSAGVWGAWEIMRIKGEKGEKGDTGVGLPGPSKYVWIKFADDGVGTNMSDSPVGKPYTGIANNKDTELASTNPADYVWYYNRGEQGSMGDGIEAQWAVSTQHTNPTIPEADWKNEVPGIPVGNYLWMRQRKVVAGVAGPWSTPIRLTGEDGAAGLQGPSMMYRGPYSALKLYKGTTKIIEVVDYLGHKYMTRVDAGDIPQGTLPTNTTYWNPFVGEFENIATGFLFADSAYIGNLTVGSVKTGVVGERTTVGELPSTPTDPSFSLSRHGARFYHANGALGIYIGVDGDGKVVLRGYKDDGELLWDLDTVNADRGIHYVTVVNDEWRAEKMRFVANTASLTNSQMSTFLGGPNYCGTFIAGTAGSGARGTLNMTADKNYQLFIPGTVSTDPLRYVLDLSSNGEANAIPDGWYVQYASYVGQGAPSDTSINQQFTFNFMRIVKGLPTNESAEYTIDAYISEGPLAEIKELDGTQINSSGIGACGASSKWTLINNP